MWTHTGSFLSSCNDVKSLSLVNKAFHRSCQSHLWHTINLSTSRNDSIWSDSSEKLAKFCQILDSNKSIAGNVHKLILSSQYTDRTTVVHEGYAIRIMSQLHNVTHIIMVQPKNLRLNRDAVNALIDCLSHRPRIHRAGCCSFHTPSMVLCLPRKVRVCEGMFPDRETAKAFFGAQSRSLKIWKGNHPWEIPFFLEEDFITPSLVSLGIESTDHHYDKIRASTILQASVRALQIGNVFDPEIIFPTLRAFAVLESLSIKIPVIRAAEHLMEMSIALPQLRCLSLSSVGLVSVIESSFC